LATFLAGFLATFFFAFFLATSRPPIANWAIALSPQAGAEVRLAHRRINKTTNFIDVTLAMLQAPQRSVVRFLKTDLKPFHKGIIWISKRLS
jgi:hypothetical protein